MRLAITRNAAQLKELVPRAALRGVEIVALPLTSIIYEHFDLPSDFNSRKNDWLVFTSANGVNAFFAELDARDLHIPASYSIAVVGRKTQQAVASRGRDISFLPSEPYGEKLFEELISKHGAEGGRVIYARAEEVISDPAELFRATGIDYFPIVCYRTITNDVDRQLADQLTNEDAILFTAPSAVHAYSEQFGRPLARLIALGHTTAAEMTKAGWDQIVTMPEPDIERVLELV